jgi:multidrug efflux pump subunit AcrB
MEEGMNAMDATISATKEIAGAVVAITIVMSAVFIPVAFWMARWEYFTASFH